MKFITLAYIKLGIISVYFGDDVDGPDLDPDTGSILFLRNYKAVLY